MSEGLQVFVLGVVCIQMSVSGVPEVMIVMQRVADHEAHLQVEKGVLVEDCWKQAREEVKNLFLEPKENLPLGIGVLNLGLG